MSTFIRHQGKTPKKTSTKSRYKNTSCK